jgi:hypothetical protein
MLLAVGMPLAVWWSFERSRWVGGALVLLFAGEIACSNSRGCDDRRLRRCDRHRARDRALRAEQARRGCGPRRPRSRLRRDRQDPAADRARRVGCGRGVDDAAAQRRVARPARNRREQRFRLQDEIGFPLAGAYRPPVPRTMFGSSGRAQAWDGALHQAARRPGAGYGFGTENKVFVDRFYSFEGDFVENTYLGILLQVGAAGLAVFLLLLSRSPGARSASFARAPGAELGPAAAASAC